MVTSCLCGSGTTTNPRCTVHNRVRDNYLRRTYNISLSEYWAIFDAQGGVCAVCGEAPREGKLLSVDHDHVDMRVRGLLHAWCNHKVVGRHRSWTLLFKASKYLQHPPAYAVIDSSRRCPKPKRKKRRGKKAA